MTFNDLDDLRKYTVAATNPVFDLLMIFNDLKREIQQPAGTLWVNFAQIFMLYVDLKENWAYGILRGQNEYCNYNTYF